jgi:hypothetical protein
MQWTWKAYAALLEGPFAESILQRSFLFGENLRLQGFTDVDETGAEAGEESLGTECPEDYVEDHYVPNKMSWNTVSEEFNVWEYCV